MLGVLSWVGWPSTSDTSGRKAQRRGRRVGLSCAMDELVRSLRVCEAQSKSVFKRPLAERSKEYRRSRKRRAPAVTAGPTVARRIAGWGRRRGWLWDSRSNAGTTRGCQELNCHWPTWAWCVWVVWPSRTQLGSLPIKDAKWAVSRKVEPPKGRCRELAQDRVKDNTIREKWSPILMGARR